MTIYGPGKAALPRVALLMTLGVALGCAKAQVNSGGGGAPGGSSGGGGTGGAMPSGSIQGLTRIEVTPPEQNVVLADASTGGLEARASYKAKGHFEDGHEEDVTDRTIWTGSILGVSSTGRGEFLASAPGRYTISARAGATSGTATLIATYKGNLYADGFPAANAGPLDGSASPSDAAKIAYPLAGAIFPVNFGPITVHITRPASQDIARLSFTGDAIDLNYYGKCEPGPGPGCYVTVPLSINKLLVAPSQQQNVKLTVRLASSTGGAAVETASIDVAWAGLQLSGGLYYWTTITGGQPQYPGYKLAPNQMTGTGIMRYVFDKESKPELVYTDQGAPPDFAGSPPATDYSVCVGCHAISPDGKLMALTVGGSQTPSYAMLDIAKRTLWDLDEAAAPATATGIEALKRKRKTNTATFTTFAPGSDFAVTMYQGQLTLRAVNQTLAASPAILGSVKELKTDPFWSPLGKFLAFTTFDPGLAKGMYNPNGINGDMKTGGQIWLATSDGKTINDDARVLVPRADGVTNFYPAISADDNLVAFNRSTCGSGTDVTKTDSDYGKGRCDGYDDSSATLWLTTTSGMAPIKLDRANGGDAYSNSWPRWSPDSGTFRGNKLYWLAYSSRRPYGLQVNTGSPASAKPQLWFAAVIQSADETPFDPSAPPVWLPNQNPVPDKPFGNHVPQWVPVAVSIE